MMFGVPTGAIAAVIGIAAMTTTPALFAGMVSRRAEAITVPTSVPERTYNAGFVTHLGVLLTAAAGVVLIYLAVLAEQSWERWQWGVFSGVCLLLTASFIRTELKDCARIEKDRLLVREAGKTREINLSEVTGAGIVPYFMFVDTPTGRITFHPRFERPWELLAILRHVAQQNALREGGAGGIHRKEPGTAEP